VSIRTKTLALLLAMSIVISTAGTAFAQDNGYEDDGDNIAGTVEGPGTTGEGPATTGNGNGSSNGDTGGIQGTEAVSTGSDGTGDGGSLPFTGLDVALILGVGGLLVAAGLATRRLTRPADAA
jgi:hypothetical protein